MPSALFLVYLVFAEVVSEVVSRTSGIVSTVFHFCFLVVDFSGRAWLVAGLDGDGSVSGLARGRRDPPSSLFRTRLGWFEWCRCSLDRVTFDTWFRRPSCLLINVHVVSLMVMSSVLIWRLRSITVRSRLRTTKCEMVVGGRRGLRGFSAVVSAVTVLLCAAAGGFSAVSAVVGVVTRFFGFFGAGAVLLSFCRSAWLPVFWCFSVAVVLQVGVFLAFFGAAGAVSFRCGCGTAVVLQARLIYPCRLHHFITPQEELHHALISGLFRSTINYFLGSCLHHVYICLFVVTFKGRLRYRSAYTAISGSDCDYTAIRGQSSALRIWLSNSRLFWSRFNCLELFFTGAHVSKLVIVSQLASHRTMYGKKW